MTLPTEFFEVEQPPEWEERTVDGVHIKRIWLTKAGMIVPQHKHEFSHCTLLANGSVRMWKNEKHVGDFKAPHTLFIEAGVFHHFQALEDNTVAYCINNLHGKVDPSLLEEAEPLVGG